MKAPINMSKKDFYIQSINSLRAKKIEETKRKLAYIGYTDEDDYNYLAPPKGYNWTPIPTHENGDFHGYTSWAENYRSLVDSFPPVVEKESPLCGNFHRILHKFRKLRWHPDWDMGNLWELIDRYDLDHGLGQVHHLCGDVRIGLALGWGGLLDKVKHYANINNKTEEDREYYRAEISLIETIINWIKRTSKEIERLIEIETETNYLNNLKQMLEANNWVAENKPRTMREACQFIAWYNISGRCYNREGAGGQLDELLRPYYENDKEDGLIDDEDAIYYLAGVLLSDTKYYQLGGPDVNGRDMVSPISWLILEAADRLNITANLTVRVHSGLDRDFFKRSVELLFKHKNAWPRFSGDQSLVEGFVNRGFSKALARERIAVGCNWMAIPGKEYPLNDSIKINMAKVFEISFSEMMNGQERSTKRLWSIYQKHLKVAMDIVVKTTDFHLKNNRYNSPELFLNLFCYGPIEMGRDVSDHSVELYTIGVDGAGIAVVADSFAALEQRIEKEKKFSWDDISKAIQANFEGPDFRVIHSLVKSANKYGQWNSNAQEWAVRLCNNFRDTVVKGESTEGAQFIPGMFSWSKTIKFGETVKATPDGRLAGEPINHGANPLPGSVENGALTTMSEAIISVQCGMGNTSPFQMELDPGITIAENGIEKIMALLETHLERGGTLINVNILDEEKILAAHKNPELYPDLVVRVTGFTAYFISLSPEFRQLVVDRIIKAN